ncbi:MAG: hypothetical protein AB7U43_11560 [Desulfobacter sp.]
MKTTILYFLVIGNFVFSAFLMSKIEENKPIVGMGIIGEVVTTTTENNTTLKENK